MGEGDYSQHMPTPVSYASFLSLTLHLKMQCALLWHHCISRGRVFDRIRLCLIQIQVIRPLHPLASDFRKCGGGSSTFLPGILDLLHDFQPVSW